jgi:hypothetical protein
MHHAWIALALVACGGKEDVTNREALLAATWTRVERQLGDVKVSVEVPAGVAENTKAVLGKQWMNSFDEGPRLTLVHKERSFDGPDGFANKIENLKRMDMLVFAKERVGSGGYRFAFAFTHDRPRTEAARWIPTDVTHGILCEAEWFETTDRLNDALVAWLDRFCASIKLL